MQQKKRDNREGQIPAYFISVILLDQAGLHHPDGYPSWN